ncbi:MAG: glycerol-3-phosphate 1-O-acyltransferase [Betaproteobacteria bacterium]|nr:MAG: glycerol-3-phosphate 1-O-acyltransferase [Betaproteobacteria bacterium]
MPFSTPDLIAAGLAYLLGSLSFAVIVSKALALPDPKSYGSGNPGATNVLRSGSKKAAILTLLGDTLKGVVAVLIAKHFAAQFGITEAGVALVAVAVFLGHLFPIFFGFKGGKGVATAAGVFFALDWRIGLALLGIWALVFALTRVSSMAAIIGSALAPVFAFYFYGAKPIFWAALLMTVLMIYRHKANIARMISGDEDSFKKKPAG